MQVQGQRQFDIFLSYKSEDADWVARLKRALEFRGMLVWQDKDQIRPGDLFAEALENGLEASRAVALVVTPESVASGWVREEYYRALSLTKERSLQLIPILLRNADMPGFLSGRHYVDFTDEDQFDIKVDRLIWPGITGKQVRLIHFGYPAAPQWERLYRCGSRLGLSFSYLSTSRLNHWWMWGPHDNAGVKMFPADATRGVVVIDMFCDDRVEPKSYIDFILKCRDAHDGVNEKIIFALYHGSDAWDKLQSANIDPEVLQRLKHFFEIPQDIPDDERFIDRLRRCWFEIQQDLIRTER